MGKPEFRELKEKGIFLSMPAVYNFAWLSLAIALPANFSLRALLDFERNKEKTMDLFWLKYWIVFAHWYLLELVFDWTICWVPFFSELKLLFLLSTSPISPFGALNAASGVPLDQIKISRDPTELLFTYIYTAAKKTKDGAHSVGFSREALRNSIPFILERISGTLFFLRKSIDLLKHESKELHEKVEKKKAS